MKWFECSECHDEVSDHSFMFTAASGPGDVHTIQLMCKKCKKAFNKNLKLMTNNDRYCSACGNCWNLPGKLN